MKRIFTAIRHLHRTFPGMRSWHDCAIDSARRRVVGCDTSSTVIPARRGEMKGDFFFGCSSQLPSQSIIDSSRQHCNAFTKIHVNVTDRITQSRSSHRLAGDLTAVVSWEVQLPLDTPPRTADAARWWDAASASGICSQVYHSSRV